ncbi:MAG: BadF/BadG/BcrA/BcrD ATPase family protein [Chloroflexota bacterium]
MNHTRRAFLGVDIGGTKTHALVADESGQALGFGAAGPGNHEVVGYDGLRASLKTAVSQALGSAGLPPRQIAGAGFGVAGYDWPSELPATLEAIATLGLACPVEAVNDAVVGLLAGASQGWGVVVVAGTSNNCRGRDRRGREGRVTGNGMTFGEYGGGAEVVWKAIQAINYAWIQRGPSTALTQTFLDLCGARRAFEFIEGLVLERYSPDASWALAVFQCAEQGDPVARQVLTWAGQELGELACAVIRQLDLQDETFEVVQSGSLYEGGALLTEPMRQTIQALAPGAQMVRLTAPPVVGGVLLGMQQAGCDGRAVRQKLIDTASRLWKNAAPA